MAYSRIALLDSVNNEITPYVDIEGIYLSEDYLTKKTASILVGIDTSAGEDIKASSVAVITGFKVDPNNKHKVLAIKQNITTSTILDGDDAGAAAGTYLQYDGNGKYSWVPGNAIDGAQGYQGPQGPRGYQGYQGTQGPRGPQGFQGPQGTQGNRGYQGFQGTQGTRGYQGFQGTQGFQGPQGKPGNDSTVRGPQGFQGPQGPGGTNGTNGTDGVNGTNGKDGDRGYQGFQGKPGSDSTVAGPRGYQGFQGKQGPTGDAWFSSGTGSGTADGSIGTSYAVYAPAFYEASDANLKTNVEPIEENIIEQIFCHEPELIKKFQWINSGEFSYGVIAQEIQKFAPELVAECDGHLKVNYDATLAMLVGALIRRVKNLESKVNMLQAYH